MNDTVERLKAELAEANIDMEAARNAAFEAGKAEGRRAGLERALEIAERHGAHWAVVKAIRTEIVG